MRILSLFDGMACGMIAMQLARVEVESYDAYEIDKYAVKTAQHNFPMIQEHGDVFAADFTQYDGVDFLVGGSPCTYWSIAQTKNRETVASGMGWELFSQYVRALREAKPKYFIYENNKSMSKQIRASIDEAFGFEAVCINSALVSAQNRQRLYWVGKRNADGTYSKVDVEQPEDRGILLKDVLDGAVAWKEKAYTIDANYYKATDGTDPFGGHQSNNRMMAAERIPPYGVDKSRPVCFSYAQQGANQIVKNCYSESQHYDYIAEPLAATNKPLAAEPINVTEDGKARTIIAQYGAKQGTLNIIGATGFGSTGAAEPITDICQVGAMPMPNGELSTSAGFRIYSTEAKGRYLCANGGGAGAKTGLYAEPVCLRYERTEEAKRCRKAYEAHEIKHGYNELNELHPRPDGKSNTLTTVLKDNRIMEPVCVAERGRMYRGQPQHYEARDDGKTNTLTSVEKDNRVAEPIRVGTYPTSDGRLLNSQGNRIYGIEGKAVTQSAQGGGLGAKTGLCAVPAMPVAEATADGYTEIECGDCVDLSMPNSKTRRGRNMADKSNCMQTSNEFYQYVGYAVEFDENGKPIKAIGKDGKQITVYEVSNGQITIKGKRYPIKLRDGFYIIRKLTVTECKRLQTVPEWYDFSCVSNSQAYKMLVNGWTCEVIKHLIDSCLNEKETEFDEQCRWF